MTRGLHWFRRDLRLRDNAALSALVARVDEWLPVFVLDPRLLAGARSASPRSRFLFDSLEKLAAQLARRDVPLVLRSGRPEQVIPALMRETGARLLSHGRAASPFARRRDAAVRAAVEKQGGLVLEELDDVVFADGTLRSGSGAPYQVFTPYRNAWWRQWQAGPRLPARAPRLAPAIQGFARERARRPEPRLPADAPARLPAGGERAAQRRLARFLAQGVEHYAERRDRPDLDGTSRLSAYLRFGAISARQCFAAALGAAKRERRLRRGVAKWLDELVWREFYTDVLLAQPRVLTRDFRPEYAALEWNDDPAGLAAWDEGRTGYPIVDAGMRQLRQSGWMHNRVRMLCASFLTKDLLIDWRRGERVFMQRLVDGDPASNNGGWQWAASTGTDAQPWFRIFNPVAQGRRFDPEGRYVKRWVPELRGLPAEQVHAPWELPEPPRAYPPPIVDHAERRALALERFRRARSRSARA